MPRKYNTLHPERSRSTYNRNSKGLNADRYGMFDNGKQQSPDRIAGRSFWYPKKEENNGTVRI